MSDERTNIIINEIYYWKQHKLLPESYCDYLLALYTKGSRDLNQEKKDENNKMEKSIEIIWNFILGLMLMLTFVIILVNEIDQMWKITLLLVILIFSSWIYIQLKKVRKVNWHFSTAILLILYLISSIHISTLYIKNQWMIFGLIFLNLIVWMKIGYKKQLKYLAIISIISIILMVFYMFYILML